ncbi:hypothetical protein CQA57_08085, partial [Helicobacter anseris]
ATNSGVIPVYTVKTTGGTANLVMQGPVNVEADITYDDNGLTNLIFASSNSGTTEEFKNGVAGATDTNNNKILGVTYQDGVKLILGKTSIQVGDGENTTFLKAYSKYFEGIADNGALLTITTDRTKDNNGNHTDNINVKGLASGVISELATSASGGGNTYTYNVNLESKSAFVGSISLQENSNVNVTMNSGSKFLTNVDKLHLQKLTIQGNSLDTTQLLLNTFEQTNTIIDIATLGNDFNNIPTRSNFRLLEIGSSTTQSGAQTQADSQVSSTSALTGSNALFRIYANGSADQSSATLGGNKQSANNGSGTYGYTYSDRIVVFSGTEGTHYLQVIADNNTDISTIKYHGGGSETEGNIAVATVKTDSNVKFIGAAQLQGFDLVGTTLTTQVTDQYGKVDSSGANDYTTYFVDSMTSKGASTSNQQASAAALGSNYDLYLANMNSLNKRMGELRENANAQGAWARIFNGMQTSN